MERLSEVKGDARGMVVLLPADVHRAVKIAAAEDGATMRELVLFMIEYALEHREEWAGYTAVN